MPFEFENRKLKGLLLFKPRISADARGFFQEIYKKTSFAAAGVTADFVQDNHSRSGRNVLRGLHYQHGQGKLIYCVFGAILDVAVDIRKGSPTFGEWVSAELTAANAHMLYLPPGFAHGFLVLSETADIVYKCTAEYSPAAEGGVRWNDPDLGVKWGIKAPLLSPRDEALPFFKGFEGL